MAVMERVREWLAEPLVEIEGARCTECGRRFDGEHDACPECGGELEYPVEAPVHAYWTHL